MRCRGLGIAGSLAAALSSLREPVSAPAGEVSIHEIIAALCRAGGEEVVPHGQNKIDDSASFLRALQATGFITSIDTSDPTQVVINFDPTVPNDRHLGGIRPDDHRWSGAGHRSGAQSVGDSEPGVPRARELQQPAVGVSTGRWRVERSRPRKPGVGCHASTAGSAWT